MHQGLIEIIVGDLTRIDYLWVAILGFVALDAPMHIASCNPRMPFAPDVHLLPSISQNRSDNAPGVRLSDVMPQSNSFLLLISLSVESHRISVRI
jgi:hypothetical protein